MKLYSYWRSTSSYRVRIALALKNLNYEYMPVHLLRGGGEQSQSEFIEHNPLGQVPVLECEVDGSSVRLSQSLAIVEYLDEVYPDPPLLPKAPLLRAKARQLTEIVNSGIQPLQNLSVVLELRRQGVDAEAWARHFIGRGLSALERHAESNQRFMLGNAPTIADVFLIPQLYHARRVAVDLSVYPKLVAIDEACQRLPAFRAAHPDQQPDAES